MSEAATVSVDKLVRRVGRKLLRSYNAHSPITRGKVRAVLTLNPYFSKLEPTEVAAIHSSIEMELDLREFVQQFIYYNIWEPHVRRVLDVVLAPGKVFFDIGANVGYYTLLAAESAGSKSVHAFEANPRTFKLLMGNVERNGLSGIHLNNLALTDSNGQIQFSIDEDNPGSSSISGLGAARLTRISVPCMTLDTYVSQQSLASVDVIKIDVEGAEVLVLRGARQTLARFRPDIVGEFSKAMMARESGGESELTSLLRDLEYRAFILERDQVCQIPIEDIYETGQTAPELFLTTRQGFRC